MLSGDPDTRRATGLGGDRDPAELEELMSQSVQGHALWCITSDIGTGGGGRSEMVETDEFEAVGVSGAN